MKGLLFIIVLYVLFTMNFIILCILYLANNEILIIPKWTNNYSTDNYIADNYSTNIIYDLNIYE